MMEYYIPIDKDAIPYRFEMQLAGETWGFEIRYNAEHDFFTVDLYRGEELVIAGEKIIYGRPLFEAYPATDKPKVAIIPTDLSGNAQRVGWDELGESVFLYLEGDGYE